MALRVGVHGANRALEQTTHRTLSRNEGAPMRLILSVVAVGIVALGLACTETTGPAKSTNTELVTLEVSGMT